MTKTKRKCALHEKQESDPIALGQVPTYTLNGCLQHEEANEEGNPDVSSLWSCSSRMYFNSSFLRTSWFKLTYQVNFQQFYC